MDIADTSKTQQAPAALSRLERITIADGLFAVALLIGAVFRFINLGQPPLSPAEAEIAWSVWRFWQAGSEALTVASPAYFSLTSFLSIPFGFSDSVVRLVPALFGLGVVCLPWLLRHRLGTVGALVTCTFLAISPLNVITSRTAGGDMIALFAVLLLATAVLRYWETDDKRWLYLAAIAVGLGPASAPLFYSGLLTLLIAWAIARLSRRSFVTPVSTTTKETWRNAIFVSLGVFAVCSSFVLWYPAGFGAAAAILGDWFNLFSGSDGRTLADPLLAAIRYEPLLIVVGVAAAIWAIWRKHPLALFTVYWLVALLILILAQQGFMALALLLTVPGYLLLGFYSGHVLSPQRWDQLAWLVALGLTTVLFLMTVNTGRFLRVVQYDPRDIQYLLVLLLAFVVAALIIYIALAFSSRAAAQGTLLAALVFLGVLSWGTSWWLAQEASNDPRERWLSEGTDGDVRLLVQTLESLSNQFSNANSEIELASSMNTPILRWYLRDFSEAQFGETIPATANSEVILTTDDATLALDSSYSGQDFGLSQTQVVAPTAPVNVGTVMDTMRWWLFHETQQVVPDERVILWVRSDLTER